jgi:hypothetical protein
MRLSRQLWRCAGNGFLVDNLTLQSGLACNGTCDEGSDTCVCPTPTPTATPTAT